jgi:rubrerythrin
MELGTFGAIISFALELELQAAEYYEKHNEKIFSQTDSKLLKNSQKRVSRLKRIRQELVTEMILEPITGVDSNDYSVSVSQETTEAEVLHQAIRLNENMHHFYSTMAPLIPMKEVQRAFLRLAKENETRVTSFKNRIAQS